MTRIKLGLVGIGKIARDQHLPVLATSADFELVAAASRNASVASVSNYKSLREMLNSRPDIEAVALCAPPGPREQDARLALEAGVHVLLEKPPAACLSAARELMALAKESVLQMSWHSRHAPGVDLARAWLHSRIVKAVVIEWREDIRVWHPGQDWILDAGGMGVFDPGINALSILTELISDPIVLLSSRLGVPAGRQAPLTADLDLRIGDGAPLRVNLDFLQTGQQTWTIRIETADGVLVLKDGGARLVVDGTEIPVPATAHHEYVGVYRRFAGAVRAGVSDCDLRPLEIVADAFLLGKTTALPAFAF